MKFKIDAPKLPFVTGYLLVACSSPTLEKETKFATAQKVMVSTQGEASTSAALEMIKNGGNIFDAAVAASFAISVERPHSTGVTGGGFAIIYEAKNKQTHVIDFRERAPIRAHARMFQDKNGNVIKDASSTGILAGGTPGLVAGLENIQKKFGKLKWEQTVEPAIRLAANGFPIYPELENAIRSEKEILAKDDETKAAFLKTASLTERSAGETLKQPDLAKTLKEFQKLGQRAWTKGETGKKFLQFQKKNRGLITQQDLDQYKVLPRNAIRGKYKNFEIVSMPPPSSGGALIIQLMNMLEGENLNQYPVHSAHVLHRYASAMQLAYADRAAWLGDPDFFKVPQDGLTDKKYAQERWKKFNPEKHLPSADIREGDPRAYESDQTTHMSLMDEEGNAIVTTHTINGYFGAGMIVDGTGMVLNNEMDDFSAKAGVPNMFGALGGTANKPAPRKTPLSSMSPTLVFENEKPILALGSPNGTRIITCVFQTMMSVLEFNIPLPTALSLSRIHYQWQPDVLVIEPALYKSGTASELQKMGYKLEEKTSGCRVQAIQRTKDGFIGASDPRGAGLSEGI